MQKTFKYAATGTNGYLFARAFLLPAILKNLPLSPPANLGWVGGWVGGWRVGWWLGGGWVGGGWGGVGCGVVGVWWVCGVGWCGVGWVEGAIAKFSSLGIVFRTPGALARPPTPLGVCF